MSSIKDNVIISSSEAILYISYDEIINFIDKIYSLYMSWDKSIIIIDSKNKINLEYTNKKYNFKNNETIFISKDGVFYLLSKLMFYHHFKYAEVEHVHCEFSTDKGEPFDLILMFKDFSSPLSASEANKILGN